MASFNLVAQQAQCSEADGAIAAQLDLQKKLLARRRAVPGLQQVRVSINTYHQCVQGICCFCSNTTLLPSWYDQTSLNGMHVHCQCT